MQNFAEPTFCKGRVLKTESLEALRDFPRDLVKIGMADWTDGILYGFDISYEGSEQKPGQKPENEAIQITAGAVWYQRQVIITKKETIPFRAFEQQITVCLRLYPASKTEDFYIRQLEIRLKNGEPANDEMELGRFRLSEGARLRKDYKDLRDCRTAYNTLDITQVPYAGPGGITVSPVLLRIFARMVMDNRKASDMDVQFAMLCLHHAPVARECLIRYLCRRMDEPLRELSHSEIYERLVQIAGAVEHGLRQEKRKRGPAVI